jgi:hypothetical protein
VTPGAPTELTTAHLVVVAIVWLALMALVILWFRGAMRRGDDEDFT